MALAGSTVKGPVPLRQLRFSPDGQFVLAQDDAGITVLGVSPFVVLFRIPAENATDGQFTPDSRQVLFVSGLSRVTAGTVKYIKSVAQEERWSVPDGIRIGYQEMPVSLCGTALLSPDGGVFVCNDFEGNLRIIDTASAQVLLEQKQFIRLVALYNVIPGIGQELPNGHFVGDLATANMQFSPDGRYLIAMPHDGVGRTLVWDSLEQALVRLTRGLKELEKAPRPRYWSFIGSDRLLISSPWWPIRHGAVRAKLVAFPSGKQLARPRISLGELRAAADPAFVLIVPFGRMAFREDSSAKRAAAAGIETGQVIISESCALDIRERYYVAEASPGVVGLYERAKCLQASVALNTR